MKKLLTLALGTLLACTLGACGSKKQEEGGKESEGHQYSKVVLAAENNTFHAVGGWEGSWGMNDEDKMAPTSIAKVAEYSTALADKLEAKGSHLKYLYVFENAQIGKDTDKDWGKYAMVNGEKVKFDGSATLKVIRGVYDEETEAYKDGQWIPDPHTAHCEALTDNVFMPIWQEQEDANGFSWANDPIVTDEGGGTYNVVVAQYDTPSVEGNLEVFEYGLAAVKIA